MAFRTWAKLLSATLGVGVLAGASQLGLAYGLGIVRLTRVLEITARDQWTAQLAWVAWFPMTAAVVAALAGTAYVRRWAPGFRGGTGTEMAFAAAAALGSAVVVPLTMQPARTAQVAGVNPVLVIAICAGLGALVGIFAAWAALAQAVARWSLITMGAAIWLVALVSVMPSLAPGDPLPAVRLGVLDAAFLAPAVTQRTALATMPALALLAGAALGWAARRRELPTLTIALAGLPGPALLTVSYLIAGPGAGADRYQVVPYWAAMTATGAGVLGSVLAAVVRRAPSPEDDDSQAEADSQATATANRPPLPQRAGKQEPAIAAAGARPPEPSSSPSAATPSAPADTSAGRSTGPAQDTAPPPTASPTLRQHGETPAFDASGGRRSSAADAFTGRTGEFPSRGATPPEPTSFDGFGRHAAPEPTPYVPEPATRPLPPEAVQQATAEQPRPAADRPSRSRRSSARGRADVPPRSDSTPTLPQQTPRTPRTRQTARTAQPARTPETAGTPQTGRTPQTTRTPQTARTPLVPEPTAISQPLPQPTAASAPLPTPQPVSPSQPRTPPQPVAPAQRPAGDPPMADSPEDPATGGGRGRKKFGLRRRKDEDFVDWVSGLGK
ncbi:hypothetical protein AB0M36_30885 [Actinoplanes sp. NPDC051346]|uniref:hypothetical protein n=1 Tax=Actinoplanes sp. NPDC051346 TaxID=3155048 RepID=UPI003418C372